MGAVGQEVGVVTLEDVRRLHVAAVVVALGVHLEKLLRVAGPLHALLGSGAAHFPDLQVVVRDLGLVDDVLAAVGVLEPRGVNGAGRGAVALDEVVHGVVDARDLVADGSSDAAPGLFVVHGLVVEGREVPDGLLAIPLAIACVFKHEHDEFVVRLPLEDIWCPDAVASALLLASPLGLVDGQEWTIETLPSALEVGGLGCLDILSVVGSKGVPRAVRIQEGYQ